MSVSVAQPPRATIRLQQQVRRGAELLVEAGIALACVDAGSLHVRRIPEAIKQAILESNP